MVFEFVSLLDVTQTHYEGVEKCPRVLDVGSFERFDMGTCPYYIDVSFNAYNRMTFRLR